ncbi:sporulation-specific 71 family protein [Aspergillus stella-maris]|uniref:sporulation-specific 71 family protein n=1 Tax=Aspergillus stella-maris TaxID=1810926 RepID=UPI003CCDE1B7
MSGSGTQNVGAAGMENDLQTPHDGCPGLEQGSYTIEKLRHATSNHVHITNKRFFIGPIPKNWLQSHRKSWYKKRLSFRNYRSRAITFSAESDYVRETDAPESTPLPIAEETEPDTELEQDEGQESLRPAPALRTLTHEYEEEDEPPSPVLTRDGGTPGTKNDSRSAYFTAREPEPSLATITPVASARQDRQPPSRLQALSQNEQGRSVSSHLDVSQPSQSAAPSENGSEVPLLRGAQNKDKQRLVSGTSTGLQQQEPQRAVSREGESEPRHKRQDSTSRFSQIANRLTLNDNLHNKQQRIVSRIARTQTMVPGLLSRRKIEDGEVVKAEMMLVRVEQTIQEELPEDYNEFDSLRMETRVEDNWREFLVVCRATSDKDAPFVLQMYKTRVVPKIQKKGKASPYHEIPLGRKTSRTNLYSSLDKSLAVWKKAKRGTTIYILRPKSTNHAVEWYTFISFALGGHRTTTLGVNVPGLAVSLIFNNPFKCLEDALNGQEGSEDSTESASQSAYLSIVSGCMKMLENRPEWAAVMKEWANMDNMGLAWKRYDRLEWIYGANEKEMYGSLAMQGTHELEFRPKQHYDTSVGLGPNKEEEPAPVEGFLIRLTSQKGAHQRMNRMFSKRLYFFTQDHYLFFCKPSQTLPPAPPRLCAPDSEIPTTQEILDKTPLSYDIDPFPLEDGQISWLSNGNAEHLRQRDEDAYAQLHRNIHNLSNADGFLDLCLVQQVRLIPEDETGTPAKPPRHNQTNWDTSATDPGAPQPQDSNNTDESTKDAGFELLLDNGLVVRFQAYNSTTRDEWMKRIDALTKYWKARTAADALELKDTRQRNLEILGIDEELESVIGQYAKKWEVRKAEASPLLHNMCSLLGCRPIKMSGLLHKKPRRHASFNRFHVVLTHGKLLVFHSTLRRQNGSEVPHIYSNLESSIDLENCYIYSGLLTETDMLYSNQTFDSNHPGHGALPRIYLTSDVYTSSDEDTAITFVIWQPIKKGFFRAQERERTANGKQGGRTRQTLKSVSRLGTHGRTIVFKARSRVEKDQWVLSIASEIDRLQEGRAEDVRLTSS